MQSYPDRKLKTYWMIKGMLTCLTKQMKHQSKQHLEDGQISDKLQQGSRDLEKAADRQKCAPISCWGDKTMTLQLAEQSRLQS